MVGVVYLDLLEVEGMQARTRSTRMPRVNRDDLKSTSSMRQADRKGRLRARCRGRSCGRRPEEPCGRWAGGNCTWRVWYPPG